MRFRFPKPLRNGDTIAVVAPASPFAREELMRGLAWLRTRYELRLTSSILSRDGYLAGTDEHRAAQLASAFSAKGVRAIVCARGGYGAMRLLDRVPWDAFAADPKWIVGFSDITALHASATDLGIASIHGPNVTGLGRSITASERASLLDALEGRDDRAQWEGLEVLHPGSAEGPLVGGNLALVSALASAGRLTIPKGALLVLEDVTERPYRIDRMLVGLRLGGHLARAGGIVFGGFTQCDPGPDGVTVVDVLRDVTASLGIPVVAGAPFGHGAPNHAFVLGRTATLEGGTVRFG